ncbi:DUF5009 domain-containing protein [Paucibacter sp. AS339]|uniref:DUF5009 domain-containing protein n=1 Tax=Paucibacter hankyongi TaxID=3133434 RepID=UPI00309D127A
MASSTETGLNPLGRQLPSLRGGRILSIDAMRALTVLVMVMVNQWHGVIGLPQWMSHMPATADAMTFVDAVFPSFLFIVGMSIPFALQQRFKAGDSWLQVQGHVLLRAAGLVLIGFFMVNAEGGFHAPSMALPIDLWGLLCYVAAFLLWGSVSGGNNFAKPWRLAGLLLFALLAGFYRGGETGQGGMTPQWWGILGLIGWAYLIATAGYQAVRGSLAGLLGGVALCTAYFVASRLPSVAASPGLSLLFSQDGHVVHASIVLCGVMTAMIFFKEDKGRSPAARSARFAWALGLALLLALVATLLRPEYKISKIYATPSWALYSAAASVLIFAALYLWIDVMGRKLWPALLAPVAANPLLAYLIPFVLNGLMHLAGWEWPLFLRSGGAGILFGAVYSLAVALLVKHLAARGLRLSI